MMQTVEIEHEIRTFLVDNFLFGDGQKLQDSVPLLGNVIDSTGVMELVLFLQDRFSITVEDEEVVSDNLDSVKSAVTFVGRKLVEKSSVT
jgi:acyl carrier protein